MKIHNPNETISDPLTALDILKDGNSRYVSNKLLSKDDYADIRPLLSQCQKPIAVILTCSDSRVAPEIFFDQKIGDIFTIRNAGNIIDEFVLGSMEYALEHLHVHLIVVVGHSKCGAVSAALGDGNFSKNLETIISKIRTNCSVSKTVEEAIWNNVAQTINQIKENPIVNKYNALVVGACYNLETGIVSWK